MYVRFKLSLGNLFSPFLISSVASNLRKLSLISNSDKNFFYFLLASFVYFKIIIEIHLTFIWGHEGVIFLLCKTKYSISSLHSTGPGSCPLSDHQGSAVLTAPSLLSQPFLGTVARKGSHTGVTDEVCS